MDTARRNSLNIINRLQALVIGLMLTMPVSSQEVTVMVNPVQQVLPPQALLYVSDPGKYFNITLINRGQSVQNVYLAMELEQVTPSAGLSITTPANRQPQTPFTLTPGQPRQLTMVEMKKLFDHIPKNEINTTPGLFDNFQNGAFGLLPEGTYKIHITAYKWDLAMVNPMPLSNPSDGICMFTVCYKAQAPDFITPMADIGQLVDLSVAQVDKQNVQFTWRQPVFGQRFAGFVAKVFGPGHYRHCVQRGYLYEAQPEQDKRCERRACHGCPQALHKAGHSRF